MKSVVLSLNTDMKQNLMLILPIRKTRGGIKEKKIDVLSQEGFYSEETIFSNGKMEYCKNIHF